MNVFAGDRTKVGQPKAQFATLFAKKHARKDNRLLCILRYRFVIETGFTALVPHYMLSCVLSVSFCPALFRIPGGRALARAAL